MTKESVIKAVKKIEPEAYCTYHYPVGHSGFHHVHVWGRSIGEECQTEEGAWESALSFLKVNGAGCDSYKV